MRRHSRRKPSVLVRSRVPAGQMVRERLAGLGPLARERRHPRGSWPPPFRRQVRPRSPSPPVPPASTQADPKAARCALRARAIAITVQLLDLQLQMGDQRLVIGLLSPGGGSLRASDNQGRFQRLDVVWQGSNTSFHEADGIHKISDLRRLSSAAQNIFCLSGVPAAAKICCGFSSRSLQANWPSRAALGRHHAIHVAGHTKRPRSSRLAYSDNPIPSCHKSFLINEPRDRGTRRRRPQTDRGRDPPAQAMPDPACPCAYRYDRGDPDPHACSN